MGTDWYENNISHSGFQGPTRMHRTLQDPQCFSTLSSISPVKPIPWTQYLTKKRQLFPGFSPTSQRSIALPHISCYQDLFPWPGLGILTQFPFEIHLRTCSVLNIHQGLWLRISPHFSGPADPCSTAVHMEPFSTLVLKDLTWVFATTTKICISDGSTRIHIRSLRCHHRVTPTRWCIQRQDYINGWV